MCISFQIITRNTDGSWVKTSICLDEDVYLRRTTVGKPLVLPSKHETKKNKININIRKIGKRGLNSLDLIGFRFFFLIHIHTYMSTHKKYSAEGFFVLLPSSTVLWSDVERERLFGWKA